MKYTRMALVLALVPCLGLISCAQQEGQEEGMEMAAMDMEALGAEMTQLEAAWEEAYEGGDATALAGLYAEDAVYMAPYGDALRGRAAVEARLAEQMEMMSERQITIERTDYGGSGDLAYGIGTYTLDMQMGMGDMAQPMTDNGKYVTLARRGADGSWKIYAHIWNTSLPEAQVAEMLSTMAGMSEMSDMSEM